MAASFQDHLAAGFLSDRVVALEGLPKLTRNRDEYIYLWEDIRELSCDQICALLKKLEVVRASELHTYLVKEKLHSSSSFNALLHVLVCNRRYIEVCNWVQLMKEEALQPEVGVCEALVRELAVIGARHSANWWLEKFRSVGVPINLDLDHLPSFGGEKQEEDGQISESRPERGTVLWWENDYGKILPRCKHEGGWRPLFVHSTDIKGVGRRSLWPLQQVEFTRAGLDSQRRLRVTGVMDLEQPWAHGSANQINADPTEQPAAHFLANKVRRLPKLQTDHGDVRPLFGRGAKYWRHLWRDLRNLSQTQMCIVLRRLDVTRACQLHECLVADGRSSDETLATLVAMLCEEGRFQQVEALVQERELTGEPLGSRICQVVIRSLAQGGLVEWGIVWMDRMPEAGLELDWLSLQLVLAALVRDGRVEQAENLLLEIKEAGKRPVGTVYTALISEMAMIGRTDRALHWLAEMEAQGVKADVIACNAVLQGLLHKSQLCAAEDLLEKMSSGGVERNEMTYGILINGYGRNGDLEGAERWLRKMGEDLPPDIGAYNALMSAYRAQRDLDGMLGCLDTMLENGVQSDEITFNILMDAFGKQEKIEEAEQVLEHMKAANIVPSKYTYTSLMGSHSKYGAVSRVVGLLQEMQGSNLKPTSFAYVPIIHALCRLGQLKKAMRVFNQMRADGIRPNVFVYAIMLHHLTAHSALELMDELLRDMAEELDPDLQLCNIVINACGKLGRFDQGMLIYEQMLERNIEPSEYTYGILIGTMLRAGDLESVVNILEQMLNAGHQPNQETNWLLNQAARKH
eukprot:gene6927-8263_t